LGKDVGSSVATETLREIYGCFAKVGKPSSKDLVGFAARTPAAIQQAVTDLLDQDDPPAALIASDGQTGLERLTILRARGVAIPQQLSVIMFEDAPWAALFESAITIIVQPTHDMGRTEAEVAFALIDSDTPPRRFLRLPADLVVRESVGPAVRRPS
jgi:LacI family transcriptional regulator